MDLKNDKTVRNNQSTQTENIECSIICVGLCDLGISCSHSVLPHLTQCKEVHCFSRDASIPRLFGNEKL